MAKSSVSVCIIFLELSTSQMHGLHGVPKTGNSRIWHRSNCGPSGGHLGQTNLSRTGVLMICWASVLLCLCCRRRTSGFGL